jgi:hypothetical protein
MVNFLSRRAGANLACKFRTPAVLCGPNSHNRAKYTTSKQIISVDTRNNKIYPRMTCAKSLLFNVTLLFRPGLEPKIARFGGPHGVSCGRGLNPRHAPLQSPLRIEITWNSLRARFDISVAHKKKQITSAA